MAPGYCWVTLFDTPFHFVPGIMADEPPVDPDLPLASLLPLKFVVVTMEFLGASHPKFFHQPALTAFLRHLAGSPEDYALKIRIDAMESGRIHYRRGDFYRFALIGLRGSEPILDNLFRRLKSLPGSAPKSAPELPFRDNWRLCGFQDAFSENAVNDPDELCGYGMDELNREVSLWIAQNDILWQWLTPARLKKEKQAFEESKGESRYCRNRDDLSGELLLYRLHDTLAELLESRGEKRPKVRAVAPPVELSKAHVFWLDTEYRDSKGNSQPMGGMSGNLKLEFASLSPAWWKLMIIGQYTGIGQRKAFGWGRYQIVTREGGVSYRRPLPACSMLREAAHEDNLARAWRHVMAGDDYALFDESDTAWYEEELMEGVELIPEAPIERLKQDLQKLLEGKYSIPPLKGRLLPKKDGGLRPLAVPPIYDRVLHRACTQILSPALEQLMYRHSHGFRPGRSRITASYEVQAAWRAGYRWVYESDIKNFFDSVDLERLKERLQAIYGNDPMVRCVIEWLKAPVVFQGQLIERVNGLPQGSPLSPLMANLMLDDFDSDLESAGFKLIRFADDFIILCKDSLQATQAAKAAEASLAEHGLDLNRDKTRITAMDEGFKYLGYLFVNDMALDISAARKDAPAETAQLSHNSWLAQFGEQQPLRLTQDDLIARLAHQLGHNLAINIGERENQGSLLALTGDPAKLTTLNKHLQIFRNDKRIYDQPWNNLQVIILFGNHQITTQAMHSALEHDISIHLARGNGSYQGVVTHHRAAQGHQLWLHQMIAFKDPDKALYCAREVVGSRLRHMKEALRRRQKAHHTPILDNAIRRLNHTNDLEELRGLEGSATAEYFQLVAQIIPEEFSFEGRNRRPPRDPFNVLLSIGYTVLYGYTESILHAVGLLPWQGFYHQTQGRHAALASDLMEPFRHLIERTALTLLLRKEINPNDFTYTPAGACRIDPKARRKYLALLLQRWESAVREKGAIDAHPYFQHLHKQALSLKDFIQKGQPFKAWQFR